MNIRCVYLHRCTIMRLTFSFQSLRSTHIPTSYTYRPTDQPTYLSIYPFAATSATSLEEYFHFLLFIYFLILSLDKISSSPQVQPAQVQSGYRYTCIIRNNKYTIFIQITNKIYLPTVIMYPYLPKLCNIQIRGFDVFIQMCILIWNSYLFFPQTPTKYKLR